MCVFSFRNSVFLFRNTTHFENTHLATQIHRHIATQILVYFSSEIEHRDMSLCLCVSVYFNFLCCCVAMSLCHCVAVSLHFCIAVLLCLCVSETHTSTRAYFSPFSIRMYYTYINLVNFTKSGRSALKIYSSCSARISQLSTRTSGVTLVIHIRYVYNIYGEYVCNG